MSLRWAHSHFVGFVHVAAHIKTEIILGFSSVLRRVSTNFSDNPRTSKMPGVTYILVQLANRRKVLCLSFVEGQQNIYSSSASEPKKGTLPFIC